jgi:integrase
MKKKSENEKPKKLTALSLGSLAGEGFHRDFGDGAATGLYVQVSFKQHGDKRDASHGFVRSWVYRFKSPVTGKGRYMGLGSCDCIGIAEARDLAKAARRLVTLGADPIEQRIANKIAERQAYVQEQASRMTFRMCVEQALPSMIGGSKSDRHRQQVRESLEAACAAFGDVAVSAIDTTMISKFLTPIWATKPTTADRTRNRIETVLDWAKVHKFRTGENPAAWKGNLEHAGFSKPDKQEHHEALPYAELPAFMAKLRARDTIGARALELLILTAARSDEIRSAPWSEFDLDKRLWIVPAERMKAKIVHTVPLSDAAVSLLQSLPGPRKGYVFKGETGQQLNTKTFGDTIRLMKADTTPHGLRSTFSTWGQEETDFDPETIEHALAHSVGTKVAQAYARGEKLGKRKLLMAAWASYCDGTVQADNVVKLHA